MKRFGPISASATITSITTTSTRINILPSSITYNTGCTNSSSKRLFGRQLPSLVRASASSSTSFVGLVGTSEADRRSVAEVRRLLLNNKQKRKIQQSFLPLVQSRMKSTNSNTVSATDSTKEITKSVTASKRGLRAVGLLPSYLADARSVPVYDKDTCPNGALQMGVAETKLMEQDWLVPALHTFATATPPPADSIYYQPTSGRTDVKIGVAKYIEEMLGLDNDDDDENSSNNNKLNIDGLVLGAGCNAVLENLCITLADPGDACLIPTPYYAAFEFDLAARAALTVVPVTTIQYSRTSTLQQTTTSTTKSNIMDPAMYYPTVAALDAAYHRAQEQGTEPRILLLSHPMNPLGICYPSHVIKTCIDWCISKQIHCISDEIYAGSVYGQATYDTTDPSSNDDETFVSALRVASSSSSSATGGLGLGPFVHWVYALSKDFGLSGLRVGVAYTENTDIIMPLQKLNDLCQISSQTQLWTLAMLQAKKHPNPQQAENELWYKAYRIENHKRLQHRATQLTQLLDQYNIPYLEPTAGLFAWINLSQFLPIQQPTTTTTTTSSTTVPAERTLYLEMIQKYGLLLTPGSSMRNEQDGFFRFVFSAVSDTEYELALQRMENFLHDKLRS